MTTRCRSYRPLHVAGLLAVAATAVLLGAPLRAASSSQTPRPAEARPDFSGTWTYDAQATLDSLKSAGAAEFATPTNIFGDSFIATQTETSIALKITVGAMIVNASYNLDGRESRNVSPPSTPDGTPIVVTSTAKWDGRRLLIASTSQSPGSGRGSINGMITVRSTRQLFLDDHGHLVIDRTGTPLSVVPNSRSVYRR